MKEFADSNLLLLKSIGLWFLFQVATVKTLELFVDNNYLTKLVFPGLMVFIFFVYYSLKVGVFLRFLRYFVAVIILAVLHVLSFVLVFKYIRLDYELYLFEMIAATMAACILIPVILYGIVFTFKLLFRK